MASELSAAQPPAQTPGPKALFTAFLGVGLSGFGGVLPFARRMLVEQRGWLADEAFNETLALCQTLPGPNIVNLSIVVGSRFAGVGGALAAVGGLLGAPVVIVLILGALYTRYGAIGRLPGLMIGLAAAAAGLAAATTIKMAEPLIRRRPLSAAPFILAAFAGVGLMHFPLIWVLLALAPLSVAAAWRPRS